MGRKVSPSGFNSGNKCAACNGVGYTKPVGGGYMVCPVCGGSGKTRKSKPNQGQHVNTPQVGVKSTSSAAGGSSKGKTSSVASEETSKVLGKVEQEKARLAAKEKAKSRKKWEREVRKKRNKSWTPEEVEKLKKDMEAKKKEKRKNERKKKREQRKAMKNNIRKASGPLGN